MAHTSNMSRSARRAAEEMEDIANESQGFVREKANDLLHSAQRVGAQAKEAALERWENFRGKAGEYVEQGREKAREMGHAVEGRVKQRPMQSLLIALGAGFILGFLFKRR